MLLADRETASLGDPFSQELLKVQEQSITGKRPSFSSLEQNIPGFSLMFVLLTLIFSVSLDLREEEVWGTNRRLSIAPVSAAALLGGKLMARLIGRHRTATGSLAVWPLGIRPQARPLALGIVIGGDRGRVLDDMLCRHRCRLRTHTRASYPRWPVCGVRARGTREDSSGRFTTCQNGCKPPPMAP